MKPMDGNSEKKSQSAILISLYVCAFQFALILKSGGDLRMESISHTCTTLVSAVFMLPSMLKGNGARREARCTYVFLV